MVFEGSQLVIKWTSSAFVSLLYLAFVGSVVTFLLYYWLMKHMEVTKVMLMGLVTPLITAALGMAKLNEQPTWRAYSGGVAILAGTGAILLSRSRPNKPLVSQETKRIGVS
jgi:drug/metabolite transporter (DMT)-like permease